MPDQDYKGFATQILNDHPELRDAMAQSEKFSDLKRRRLIDEVEGEKIYLVNDTQGGEEDLYIDSLAKGAKARPGGRSENIYHELYQELDDRLKVIVKEKIAGEDV